MTEKLKQFEPRAYPRVEFLSLKKEIEDLLRQGYSAMGIWRKLREERNILMSYTSLTRYIRNQENRAHSQGVTAATVKYPKAATAGHGVTNQVIKHDADTSDKVSEFITGDDTD